jgi:hypothetical protein
VKALVHKGLDANGIPITSLVGANDSASLANIVSQVLGQDASRTMNVDNSERTRDQHILLRFYAGDVIYMNIKLKTPSVNVGNKNQLVSGATLESMYSEENFTIKITLANPVAAPAAPPAPGATTMTLNNTISPVPGMVVIFYSATQAYGAFTLGLYKLVGGDYVKTDDIGGTPVGNFNYNSNSITNGDQVIVLLGQAATVPVASASPVSNLITVAF